MIRPLRILVSVRDLAEARVAAAAQLPFIDLKEPAAGALGGLAPAAIAPIVGELRRLAPASAISATIGDWPAEALAEVAQRCHQVAACGVDHVKVGVVPGPAAPALLQRLAGLLHDEGLPIVPVLIADAGVPQALVAQALDLRFGLLMLDTAAKTGGSLFERCGAGELAHFVSQSRAAGVTAGLAGALRRAHWPQLCALAPDFAGFRSAVCAGDRARALDPALLHALLALARPLASTPP